MGDAGEGNLERREDFGDVVRRRLAFDIGVFRGREYCGEHPLYNELGTLGKSLGLEWGGDWKFCDEPHYQLRPSWAKGMTERDMLATLRNRVSKKIDVLA